MRGLKPDPNIIGARLLQAVPSPLCSSTRIKGIDMRGLKPDPNIIGVRLLQAVPSPLCSSCFLKPLMIICRNK